MLFLCDLGYKLYVKLEKNDKVHHKCLFNEINLYSIIYIIYHCILYFTSANLPRLPMTKSLYLVFVLSVIDVSTS